MKLYIDYWNDKCSYETNLFILCMNGPKSPSKENKCKDLFDSWLKCINLKYK
jgi:hypothetical protein